MPLKTAFFATVRMIAILTATSCFAAAPIIESEQIFPIMQDQQHAPSIVECPNGDLLAAWYGGSEGPETDAAVWGARRRKGESQWSQPYIMADRPGFPDCNTCMMIDSHNQLWLFYPTIVGNTWETCLMNYRVSSSYNMDGSPVWLRDGLILLNPENFRDEALRLLGDRKLRPPRGATGGPDGQKLKLDDLLYQRLGWAPRCKPTVLPGGRIVLPLYTDTFACSIMALSDDGGNTWFASKPLLGFGNIQPTVLRRNDGTLVAYMRTQGTITRIRVSESTDDGVTWSEVGQTELPNPGSGIDAVRLQNGHWILIYNDSEKDRARLAVTVSKDEGKTWLPAKHLERHEAGRYHYPAIIQGSDGMIHAIYACFIAPEGDQPKVDAEGRPIQYVGKGIKHAAFNEEWALSAD